MELRSQTQHLCLTLALLAAPLAAEVIEVGAVHGRWRARAEGVLRLDDDGVAFASEMKARRFHWRWREIQSLELVRDRIIVTGYRDRGIVHLYADERAEFRFAGTPSVERLYAFLEPRMDQRLIARIALPPRAEQWRIGVKRLRKARGAQGELIVEPARILFVAQGHGESRVWRDSEIDLISSSGPHQLSITAREPDTHYDFQLKQALDPKRYDALWLRLNRPRGLALIDNQQPKETQP
jgi:hypothetical protein